MNTTKSHRPASRSVRLLLLAVLMSQLPIYAAQAATERWQVTWKYAITAEETWTDDNPALESHYVETRSANVDWEGEATVTRSPEGNSVKLVNENGTGSLSWDGQGYGWTDISHSVWATTIGYGTTTWTLIQYSPVENTVFLGFGDGVAYLTFASPRVCRQVTHGETDTTYYYANGEIYYEQIPIESDDVQPWVFGFSPYTLPATDQSGRYYNVRESSPWGETFEASVVLVSSPEPPSPLPNIKMISATTPDSRSVSFTYQITGNTVPQFEVGVYRSAGPTFDAATDIRVASDTLMGANPGTYSGSISVPLVIDPSHPYVFVVANPNGTVRESTDSDNSALFRKFVIGVVTHGFQLFGVAEGLPSWLRSMCAALQSQGYDATVPFDWSGLSSEMASGRTLTAAAGLASQVKSVAAKLPMLPGDVIDTHWIGHSRGAVVISYAFADLAASRAIPEVMQGYVTMTMLDPHPAVNHPSATFYSFCPIELGWLLATATYSFQALAQDPDPFFPAGVMESEVYYQQTPWFEAPRPPVNSYFESIINLWGIDTIATQRRTLLYSPLLIGHQEVPEWYTSHVIPGIGSTSGSSALLAAEPTASTGRNLEAGAVSTPVQTAAGLTAVPTSDIDVLYPALVDNQGVARSMTSKLAAAHAAFDRGNVTAGRNVLGAFINEIRAQRGKHITTQAADIFTAAARTILEVTK